MFNILSQTLKVKFLRNEEQRCLLPSLVDDFTCVHSKNALLTHILSTLFSSTSVLFSGAPFGTKSYIMCVWEEKRMLITKLQARCPKQIKKGLALVSVFGRWRIEIWTRDLCAVHTADQPVSHYRGRQCCVRNSPPPHLPLFLALLITTVGTPETGHPVINIENFPILNTDCSQKFAMFL